MDLSVQDELHKLVLKSRYGSVESGGHAPHIRTQIRTKVLYQSPVSDLGVQNIYMRRDVHVKQNIILDIVQQFQARGVLRLVELENNVPQLWLQLQKELERAAEDDLFL